MSQIAYIDETGLDTYLYREYAYSSKGIAVYGEILGRKFKRVGIVTAQIDGKIHIGIENVRDRLWSICGGTLTIKSEVGRGTTATIKISKGDAKR